MPRRCWSPATASAPTAVRSPVPVDDVAPLLAVEGLTKRYGGVVALDAVDLVVRPGEVHALVGENGAGKSTLIKCLSGIRQPDAGRIVWAGSARHIAGPRQAEAMGISFIHQELNLVPNFTASEMLTLGRRYPTRLGLIDGRAMRERARALAADLAPDLPLTTRTAALTPGQRQLIEILRALAVEARLIVMDEPTASLSRAEAKRLHSAIRRLSQGGTAILFVSHRLEEVFDLCSRVTVLRNGRSVVTAPLAGMDRQTLVRHMSGAAEAGGVSPAKAAEAGRPPVLTVDGLPFGKRGLPLSLSVAAGEIVGLYGLVGAGRSRLLRTIWGAEPVRNPAAIRFRGLRLGGGVATRVRAGIAYIPEDRRTQGLVLSHSVLANATLPHLRRFRSMSGLPAPSRRRMSAFLSSLRDRLSLRFAGPDVAMATLSGGNQQKVLVGRWMAGEIPLMLLDEPTRGIDVGAKRQLHAVVRAHAEQGTGVLMASSDLEEVLGLADRVVVMAAGRIVGSYNAATASPQAVLDAAFAGVEAEASA